MSFTTNFVFYSQFSNHIFPIIFANFYSSSKFHNTELELVLLLICTLLFSFLIRHFCFSIFYLTAHQAFILFQIEFVLCWSLYTSFTVYFVYLMFCFFVDTSISKFVSLPRICIYTFLDPWLERFFRNFFSIEVLTYIHSWYFSQ